MEYENSRVRVWLRRSLPVWFLGSAVWVAGSGCGLTSDEINALVAQAVEEEVAGRPLPADGEQGAQGALGAQGDPGPEGPAGEQGDAGSQGSMGEQGDAGPEGPSGGQGGQGDQGASGPSGPAGEQGDPGAEGSQGPAGPAGPAGPEGPEGPEGPAGPAGPEGPVGPQGPPGDSPWMQSGDDTFYTQGNVGIGTDTPTKQLSVVGASAFDTAIIAPGMGTDTDVAFTLSQNNAAALRIEPSQDANFADQPNIIAGHSSNSAGDGVGGAAVYGGASNSANGSHSTVAGGQNNSATGEWSFVGGGDDNSADGEYSFVAAGFLNSAAGDYSFASGARARATFDGQFVRADSQLAMFPADHEENFTPAVDQFLVRARGGAVIVTATDTAGRSLAGVKLDAGGGAWSMLSDRHIKENIKPVDVKDVLDRVSRLPISRWNYKTQDASVQHIGPMAQDFHRAFPLSKEDRFLSPIDTDGVALASIQALHALAKEKDAKIAALTERLARLEALLAKSMNKQ